MDVTPVDFESTASTIPPGWHKKSYTSLYFDSNKSLSSSSSVVGSTKSGNSSIEDKPK